MESSSSASSPRCRKWKTMTSELVRKVNIDKQLVTDFIIAILLYVFFCIAVYYAQVNELGAINSDNAFPVLAGQAMFSGNPLLEGWSCSTRPFYFDVFIFGVAGQFFGYNFRLVYKVAALSISLLFAGICYIALRLNKNESRGQRAARLLLAASMCLCSIYVASNATTSNWAGSHVFAAIVGLMLVWNLYRVYDEKRTLSVGLVISYVMVAFAMGDYLLLYFSVLPAALVLIHRLAKHDSGGMSRKQIAVQLVLLIVAVILNCVIIGALEVAGGMSPCFKTNSVTFIASEDMPSKFFFAFECLLSAFNGDFFGKAFSVQQIGYYAVGLIVIIVISGAILNFRGLMKMPHPSRLPQSLRQGA